MGISIETGIPIPANIRTRGKYPLDKLKIGDSFFVEVRDAKKARNLRSTFAVRAKKIGMKVVSASDAHGVRVWRTQ